MVLLRGGAMVESANPRTLWARTWARESRMTALGGAEPARTMATRRRSPTLAWNRPCEHVLCVVMRGSHGCVSSTLHLLVSRRTFVAFALNEAGGRR